MTDPAISVVIPTRNPDRGRLGEVLAALRRQTARPGTAEVCLVDNGSTPALQARDLDPDASQLRIVREERPGLLAARLCGLQHTSGRYVVFIDDDTVPDPGFVSAAVAFMDAHPQMGTAGGKILPRYLAPPPPWIETVTWLLALRDNGPAPLEWSAQAGAILPNWTPIGAGLLVRRAVVPDYLQHATVHATDIERISWRGQGAGGVEDKDLVLHCLRAGWSTGYTPDMILTHIIPPERLHLAYFEMILPAVLTMWAQTLHAHGFACHTPIHPATLPLRKLKAWLVFRAWRSPSHRLRWLESCGYLAGLAQIYRRPFQYPSPRAS